MSTEVMLVAQNIARNLGWPVFPCGWNSKTPTRPRSQGGRGFKDATVNPDEIKWLWRRWPGGLIGIATGEVSGIDVLDVDFIKHPIALRWWVAASKRVPPTRTGWPWPVINSRGLLPSVRHVGCA